MALTSAVLAVGAAVVELPELDEVRKEEAGYLANGDDFQFVEDPDAEAAQATTRFLPALFCLWSVIIYVVYRAFRSISWWSVAAIACVAWLFRR